MPTENTQKAETFHILFITEEEDGEDGLETINRMEEDDSLVVTSAAASENSEDAPLPGSFDAVVVDFGGSFPENMNRMISKLNFVPADEKRMVLGAVPGGASADARHSLLRTGFDDCLVEPVSSLELKRRLEWFYQAEKSAGDLLRYKSKLEQTFGYLDRYREKLSAAGKELHEERRQLNHSLKQISLMTDERKRLKTRIKSYGKRITEGLEAFSRILSHLIEIRVETNRGHARRVADAAIFVAQQMELGEKELETLQKACLLHEIGMLLLPEDLADKENPDFSEYGRDLLHQYPAKGADLLESCPGLEKTARTVRYLNECMDGSGGPEGLKGRNIPVGARILAGADRFDELRFRDSEGRMDGWISGLEEQSGTVLDPLVVHYLQKYAATRLAADGSDRIKGIGIHQLAPGMTLGVSLFTAGGTKLFSAETLLDTAAIEKIIRYNREYPVNETIYIKA
ncbi:MAG: HD domain-containing protein [Desulfarculaceae bacterium]|nr:HD domain-containing protein [Desulfarculaceae bacterium]